MSSEPKKELLEEAVSPSTPAEQESNQLIEKASQKRTQVEMNVDELSDSLVRTNTEILTKEKDLETKVAIANQAISSMQNQAISSVTNIQSGVNNASSILDSAFGQVRRIANTIPFGIALVYYMVYLIEFGVAYNSFVWGGVAIAAIVGLTFRVILDRAALSLENTEDEASEQVTQARLGLTAFLTTRLGIQPNLKRVKDGLASAAGYGEVIVSSMRDFFPALQNVYEARERMNRQIVFIKSLRNSMNIYGVRIGQKANDYLSHFGPLTESESEWVDEASSHLTSVLGISPMLIRMMYFDYTADDQELKNNWKEIQSKPKLLTELSKLLVSNGLIDTEYLDKNADSFGAVVELLRGQEKFDLKQFRADYEIFYIDLTQEKKTAIEGVRDYGFKVSASVEERTLKFFPPSFEFEARQSALFNFISQQLGLSDIVVRLAYYERESDVSKRIQTWSLIRRQRAYIQEFVSKLFANGVLEAPTQYIEQHQAVVDFGATELEKEEDFTVAKAKRKLALAFSRLDSEKETFLRFMSGKILLSESDRKKFSTWLSSDITAETIAKWLQNRTDVPDYVLLLFYYDYIQDGRERKRQFETIKKPEKLLKLAEALLGRTIIPLSSAEKSDDAVSNLSVMLMKEEDYDRARIQSEFSTYNRLLGFAKGALDFLIDEELSKKGAKTDFESLLKVVKPDDDTPSRQENDILSELVRSHSQSEFNTSEWHEPITKAVLALYFVSRESVLSRSACKAAAASEKATKILYQYSRVNDEEIQRGEANRTKFADIIRKTIDGTYTNVDYLVPFQAELTSGFLYTRVSHLLQARLSEIDKKIGDKKKLEDTLRKYTGAVNTFLESKLEPKVILESLRMQLINGYIITKLGTADVVRGIIDDELPRVCRELAQDDPVYNDLLLISGETLGPGTRIGIVPFQMDFSTFSGHFETAFQLAAQRHAASDSTHRLEEFTGNLIRFFPSDAYFKRVESTRRRSDALPSDHPAQIIRRLVLQHYGAIENIELISSMQAEFENPIAMKSMVTTWFNTDTRIYLMAETQLGGILGGSQFLDFVNDNKFDRELWKSFGCKTRSDLALSIFVSSGNDGTGKNVVKKNLEREITRLAKLSGARLSNDQIENVTLTVYQVLYEWGMVLRGLSPQ